VATTCPSFLRGNVMRVTRLNNCGQPIYGDCNQVVSDGFVTVTLSAEVEEGEEVTVTKANGQTCISDKACDQLRWYTSEIEFCQVDPDLIQIMNPTWEKILDYQGDTIGYDAKGNLSCDTGFALEIWMDTYGATDACSGEGAQGAYGYLLLPWVVGGAPGDLEIGNDAISFTFNGRTKLGSRWGKGPYPVMLGENGAPGPLLTPITAQTQYRLFVTTIRPPEPECGCQPVDRPTPEPATLTITGIPGETVRMTVRMRVDNHGFGPTMVDWGDGTDSQQVADGAYVTHTYEADGEYTITVSDQQTPAIVVTKDITIPLPADEPTLVLTADNPANRMEVTAAITLPEQSSGEGTIDWGDGTDVQSFTVDGTGAANLDHIYSFNGVYTVTVRRSDVETFRARQAVAVPVATDPTLAAFASNADTSGQTVSINYANTGNGPVTINWGDGTAAQDGTETGTAVTHEYADPGTYNVVVASKANPASSSTIAVTAPLMVLTATETSGNANSTDLLVENWTAGSVVIDWGDGGPTGTNVGDGTTVTAHVYGAPGTYTIVATDASDATRKGSVTVTIPWP